MTRFADNIYSGAQATTSAASSKSPVMLSKTFRFTGGGAPTQTAVLPADAQNLDAKLFILANGSAATTDTITVSAGGTTLMTFSSFGSAIGVVRQTVAALGTFTPIASACANPGTAGAETSISVTLASVDTATDYQLQLMFSRRTLNSLGNAG